MKYPIIHAILEQGSPEWHKIRIGKFTGSEFHKLTTVAKTPDILPAGALTYCEEVAVERITGRPAKNDFSNYDMEHGKRHEPIARQIYEKLYGVEVNQVGFIDFRAGVGYSPDGLVLTDGAIEIKCPATTKPHFDFLRMKSLKEENAKYYWQVLGGLLCSEREWIDFISYSPFFPAELQFKKYRVHREGKGIAEEIKFLNHRLQLAELECQRIIKELSEPSTGLLTT